MPSELGEWSYSTSSDHASLHGKTGKITCVAGTSRGVERSLPNGFGFAYDDGTPMIPVGTTSYAWLHQPEGDALEEKTLQSLAGAPFNKIRMTIFPKWYPYTHDEPRWYPFEGSFQAGNASWDYGRFNPQFWRHVEERVSQLNAMGVIAEIILFHPYDGGAMLWDRPRPNPNSPVEATGDSTA